jgi:hypothetical protein
MEKEKKPRLQYGSVNFTANHPSFKKEGVHEKSESKSQEKKEHIAKKMGKKENE